MRDAVHGPFVSQVSDVVLGPFVSQVSDAVHGPFVPPKFTIEVSLYINSEYVLNIQSN